MRLSETMGGDKDLASYRKVRGYFWDRGICPYCGSTRIKNKGENENLGFTYYKCRDCGTRGEGLWVGDSSPTRAQVAEYELKFNL